MSLPQDVFFCIHPPPGLLPVLGLLRQYMTPTLDAALLMCGSPEQGRTTSSRAGADLGRTSEYLYERAALQLTHPNNTCLWVGDYCKELLYCK